nr:hypothetical protein [Tanacetum cinerariifolium]GEV73475.1 hypothetical protein [Tanacetum cinerariifolium]
MDASDVFEMDLIRRLPNKESVYPGHLVPSDDDILEEDPRDYHANADDDEEEEEESFEDDDDEQKEHLAPAGSTTIASPAVDRVPSAAETEPFGTDELLALPAPPPSPLTSLSSPLPQIPSSPLPVPSPLTTSPTHTKVPLGYRVVGISLKAASPLPSPTSPPTHHSLPLHAPSISRKADIPEADIAPRKRLLLIAPTPRFEVGESSAAARQPGSTVAHRVNYSFLDTMDAGIRASKRRTMAIIEVVNLRGDRAALHDKVDPLRMYLSSMCTTHEQKRVEARQALDRSKAHNRALEERIVVLETQVHCPKWRHHGADDHATRDIMRIQALEARARNMTQTEAGMAMTAMIQEVTEEDESMLLTKSDKVEKYVDGLPDMIQGSVMASKPKKMQDEIKFATELMDQKIRTLAEQYFSEDYDEEREIEPRPKPARAVTPPLRVASLMVHRRKERAVGLRKLKTEGKAGSKKQRRWKAFGKNTKREWKSKCKPSLLLAVYIGRSENGKTLQSSLTSAYRACICVPKHACVCQSKSNMPFPKPFRLSNTLRPLDRGLPPPRWTENAFPYWHETNKCQELKHQIEEAVNTGHLAHLVNGVTKKREKTSNTQLGEKKKEEKPALEKTLSVCPHKWSAKNINYRRRNLQHQTSTEFVQSHRTGVLQKVKYQIWVSNPIIVKKDDGKRKLRIDFTNINKACTREPHPLPAVEIRAKKLHKYRLKSFLYTYKGYPQIPMAEKEKKKHSSQENEFFATKEDMLADIKETFGRLWAINLKLNTRKCSFGVDEGVYSGHLVTKQGIRADPSKVKAISALQPPKMVSEIQNFSKKLTALNRFLSKSTKKALCFMKTLKSCTSGKMVQWTTEANEAIQRMKECLESLPTMVIDIC